MVGNLTPTSEPDPLPEVAHVPEVTRWLNEQALTPFLNDVRNERVAEVERIAQHVELSLTEVLRRTDQEIGRAAEDVARGAPGAEGRQAQAEARHAEVLAGASDGAKSWSASDHCRSRPSNASPAS